MYKRQEYESFPQFDVGKGVYIYLCAAVVVLVLDKVGKRVGDCLLYTSILFAMERLYGVGNHLVVVLDDDDRSPHAADRKSVV